ncbi:MAG: PhoD-like phosphatase N-terminal domain-containing protein, partial [Rhodothermales bacterium]
MNNDKKSTELSRRDFLTSSGKVAAASVLAGTAPLEQPPSETADTPHSTHTFPEDCVRPDREWQYKRLCKRQVARIEDGDIDGAIKCLSSYLNANPVDVEYMYGLALGYTVKGDLDQAISFVKRAVDNGLPFGRFLAGPRQFLAPLYAHHEFQQLAARYGSELVHGPLLGSVTDSSASFWVRTWHESSFRIAISASEDMADARVSDEAQTLAVQDFTAVSAIEGLAPDTVYFYQLKLAGQTQEHVYTFKTFPQTNTSGQFTFGFGGCSGYTPWHERIWRLIAEYNFPLFLLTGDNVYIDDPTRPGVQDYTYYRRQSRPE